MAIKKAEYIWQNGKMIPWDQACVHVLAHGLHYGTSVFEGIRAYATENGTVIFRLQEHIRRLYDSARIHGFEIPYDRETLTQVCHQILESNQLSSAYIRPLVYMGYGSMGLATAPDIPFEVSVAAFEWGKLLGEESANQGVSVCVSSWNRPAPNTHPTMAKAGGNYLSSRKITDEARRAGYDEGIALDVNGYLSEAAGANLFLVRDGVLYTPAWHNSILLGITRDSVIQLAKSLGVEVKEVQMPRELLYLADEAFLTGTAAEVVPISSVDGTQVGTGSAGPVTRSIQAAFTGLFTGETKDQWGWLEPLKENAALLVEV